MQKKQFAVIGLGTFGLNMAKELAGLGAQVLAIDNNEERVNEASAFVAQAVIADATEEKALRDIGIIDCDVAIIAIGENMETSIMITLLLKELGIKNIIVKAMNPLHSRIAAKIGADKVVFPEYEVAKKLSENLVSPNILEEIELSPEYNIVEMVAPKKFWGKSIRESDIRAGYRISVIAIKRLTPVITEEGESDIKEDIVVVPEAEDEIRENDILLVVGRESDLQRLKAL